MSIKSYYENRSLETWTVAELEDQRAYCFTQLQGCLLSEARHLEENPDLDLNSREAIKLAREYAQRIRELKAEIESRPILE